MRPGATSYFNHNAYSQMPFLWTSGLRPHEASKATERAARHPLPGEVPSPGLSGPDIVVVSEGCRRETLELQGLVMMRFVIRKGPPRLSLFWSRDGWQANSHFATKYATEEAAEKAIKHLGFKPTEAARAEAIDGE